jgi:hypothetical protein
MVWCTSAVTLLPVDTIFRINLWQLEAAILLLAKHEVKVQRWKCRVLLRKRTFGFYQWLRQILFSPDLSSAEADLQDSNSTWNDSGADNAGATELTGEPAPFYFSFILDANTEGAIWKMMQNLMIMGLKFRFRAIQFLPLATQSFDTFRCICKHELTHRYSIDSVQLC